MTTTEFDILGYLEQAHDALVGAAKVAHLDNHPEAGALSKLIDDLEEIDCRIFGKISWKVSGES
jgi:hypothetical protein